MATAGLSGEDPSGGEDRKFAVFGALDDATGQIIWQLSPQKEGTAFIAFLDHLVSTRGDDPRVIVLDHGGDHKGWLAKDWRMAHHDRCGRCGCRSTPLS